MIVISNVELGLFVVMRTQGEHGPDVVLAFEEMLGSGERPVLESTRLTVILSLRPWFPANTTGMLADDPTETIVRVGGMLIMKFGFTTATRKLRAWFEARPGIPLVAVTVTM